MIAFTAGVLVGMALAAFAALALAYYLDRREQMASMRRHSQMTAALSGMGTPRPTNQQTLFEAEVWRQRGDGLGYRYLPDSNGADFQP